jgi:hypothetical protein
MYTMGPCAAGICEAGVVGGVAGGQGRPVQVDSMKTRLESAYGVCNQRLKLKHDEPAFKLCFQYQLAPLHQGSDTPPAVQRRRGAGHRHGAARQPLGRADPKP